jgi:hypothetical protein
LFIEAIAFVAPFMAPATAVFACMAYIPTHFSNKFEQRYKAYHRPHVYKRSGKHIGLARATTGI